MALLEGVEFYLYKFAQRKEPALFEFFFPLGKHVTSTTKKTPPTEVYSSHLSAPKAPKFNTHFPNTGKLTKTQQLENVWEGQRCHRPGAGFTLASWPNLSFQVYWPALWPRSHSGLLQDSFWEERNHKCPFSVWSRGWNATHSLSWDPYAPNAPAHFSAMPSYETALGMAWLCVKSLTSVKTTPDSTRIIYNAAI